jgi:hypothetical protein
MLSVYHKAVVVFSRPVYLHENSLSINIVIRSGILTAVNMSTVVFWVTMPHSLADYYQHLRGKCRVHLQRSNLKVEETRSSEILVTIYKTTQRFNPEDHCRHVDIC